MGIGSLIGLVGSGISAWSQWQAGESANAKASDQADHLRQVAAANREISLLDASAAEKDAAVAETAYGWRLRRHLVQVGKLVGSARTGYAKGGVAISGSALDTVARIARDGAEDAALIAHEGKTAGDRGREVAERYRALADAGLRDAAFQASLIESAGADQAFYGRLQSASTSLAGVYDYGESKGWWE